MVDYKFILEVARHGARAPSVLYDVTAEGVTQFDTPMELTMWGAKQHENIGKYARETYFSGKSPADGKVYTQSTEKNRTKQSATSQLQGLYGESLTFPDLQADEFPLITQVDEDRLILTDGKNCDRFKQIEKDISDSPEWKELFETKMPAYLNPNLYDKLKEQEPDWKDFDLLAMSDVGTYVFTATVQDMELEFPVDDDMLKWSAASADQFTYEWLGASPQLWQLSMQKMLTLMIEAVDVVFDDKAPSSTEILKTNLYAQGSSFSDPQMPYFWILLGHQETLWPLTAALGIDRAAKLGFASSYFFEFFSDAGEDYVKAVFRDGADGKLEAVPLGCSSDDIADSACTSATFKAWVQERLAIANEVKCDQAYTKNAPYADTDKYVKQLFSDLDINIDSQGEDGAMNGLMATTLGLTATTLAFLF